MRSNAVSRSAISPAAFSVPFLAGQKGDIPFRAAAVLVKSPASEYSTR
jgi:hypothetical protein